MQSTEMIESAQNGDKVAYGELMELHHRTVEKFAFQCGVRVEDIQDLTQDVFIELYRILRQFQREQFTTWLYKNTLNATRNYFRKEKREKEEDIKLQDNNSSGVSTRSPQSRVLVFEEDRELHDAIQLLEEKYRNPIILFYFHELSLEQIGEILNIPSETVETRLVSSKEQLKSALAFEQQLNLLKKSYNRVPSKFNVDEVLQKLEAEDTETKNGQTEQKSPTSSWQKGSIWSVSLASVFLIGILSASFLNENSGKADQEVPVSDANDIEELKKSFEKEKATRREMLELTEEEFDQIGFVNMANQMFSSNFHPDRIESGYSSITMEERYEQVIETLKLPSEMIKEASEKGKMNEQESMAFIEELNSKIDHLLIFYNSVMEEHREILNTAKMNGQLDASYLFVYRTDLPQVLESMINNAPGEGIAIKVSPDKKSYQAYFEFSPQWNTVYEFLEGQELSLFSFKQMVPFTNGGELILTPQESAMYLNHLEQVLLSTKHRSSLYAVMKSHYEDLAYTLIFGTPKTEIVTNGRVNDDFRLAWNNLRYSHGISPMKYFIRPMLESVSENNWEVNETYRALNFNDLQVAFTLAENGDLEAIMPKEDSGAKSMTINWPNSKMQEKVAGYIKNGEYEDIYTLIGVTPIESILLFDYAQEMNFESINNQLLSFINFQDYDNYDAVMNSWVNNKLISEEATSLRYQDEKSFEKYGNFVGSVDVMNGEHVIRSIPIIRNERGFWMIDVNSSFSQYYEPHTELNEETLQSIQDFYIRFKESHDHSILQDVGAKMVAGIYLEASTQGDLETQYELLLKGENTNTPSKEEFLSYPLGDDIDWKKKFRSFESIQSNDKDENEEYDVTVWLYLNEEFISSEEHRQGFQMRKSVDGWRVQFMPIQ